jgi:hypothetical protein
LKEALGMTESLQLPDFIYKMRWFGYPPGHRLAAEEQVRLQQLSMYDEYGHGETDSLKYIGVLYHAIRFCDSVCS